MAVGIDPLRTSHRRIGALGWDGGPCAHLPDALAKGIGGEAAVTDNPSGHIGQATQQPRSKRQFMRLSGGERKGNGPPAPLGDYAGFCAVAAATAAKRLTTISLLAVDPPFCAPAALW